MRWKINDYFTDKADDLNRVIKNLNYYAVIKFSITDETDEVLIKCAICKKADYEEYTFKTDLRHVDLFWKYIKDIIVETLTASDKQEMFTLLTTYNVDIDGQLDFSKFKYLKNLNSAVYIELIN